jgi:hypothetical protein
MAPNLVVSAAWIKLTSRLYPIHNFIKAINRLLIHLVQGNPKHNRIRIATDPERTLYRPDVRAPAFDNKYAGIQYIRHGVELHKRRHSRQIDNDVFI